MRYFVTGSRGFAASHLVYKLLQNPENFVVGIDCLYPCASRKDPSNATPNNYVFVKGDLNEKDLVAHLLNTYHFDIIISMASQTHVDTSFSTPYLYAKDNFMAMLVLLESVKLMPSELRPRILHLSTDEVLGSTEGKAKSEDAILKPSNCYSATKSAQECLIHAYKCSHKLQIIVVRPNNLYSKFQYQEKCIPRFITLLRDNIPLTIHGNGDQQRAFLHVDDLISAMELLIEKGVWGETYHISSDDEISIIDLAKKLAQLMGKEDTYRVRFVLNRAFNDVRYHISSEALRALGWSQKVKFEDGLRDTIQWYLSDEPETYFMEKYQFPVQKDISQPDTQTAENNGETPSKRIKLQTTNNGHSL